MRFFRFINGATFFAFSLHLGSVGTNPWLTLGTSGLAVVPGAFLCMFCVQKFGRKLSLIYANLVISFCLIMMQGIPLEWDWVKLPLISLSVIALSVSFTFRFTRKHVQVFNNYCLGWQLTIVSRNKPRKQVRTQAPLYRGFFLT